MHMALMRILLHGCLQLLMCMLPTRLSSEIRYICTCSTLFASQPGATAEIDATRTHLPSACDSVLVAMEFQSWWDIALGVLAIITAITGVLFFIQKQLPSNNVQTMYDILDDTTSLLLSCEKEGHISADVSYDFREKIVW